MTAIIDYYIVSNDDIDSLTFEVKELLTKGWQPLGQLVGPSNYNAHFQQVMVKYYVFSEQD